MLIQSFNRENNTTDGFVVSKTLYFDTIFTILSKKQQNNKFDWKKSKKVNKKSTIKFLYLATFHCTHFNTSTHFAIFHLKT